MAGVSEKGEIKIEKPYEEHRCINMPGKGIYLYRGRSSLEQPDVWHIQIIREATERDLDENHYLNEEGEHIWTVLLEISFCPYCGSNLYEGEEAKTQGEFILLDTSGRSLVIK